MIRILRQLLSPDHLKAPALQGPRAGFMGFFPAVLAQVKLEDVFKSAEQSMHQAPGTGRLLALVLGAVAIVLLLAILQQRRKQAAIPRPVNHQGRLLKEILETVPLKKAELKQLKQLAEEHSYSSPLLLLLCPSLLSKAMQGRTPAEREALAHLLQKNAAESQK